VRGGDVGLNGLRLKLQASKQEFGDGEFERLGCRPVIYVVRLFLLRGTRASPAFCRLRSTIVILTTLGYAARVQGSVSLWVVALQVEGAC